MTVFRRYTFVNVCDPTKTTTWDDFITVADTVRPVFTKKPNKIQVECNTHEPYIDYADFVSHGGEAVDNCFLDPSPSGLRAK